MLTLLFFLGGSDPAAAADTHDGAGYIYQTPKRRAQADAVELAKRVDARGIAETIREQLAPKAPKPRPAVKVTVAFDFDADDEEALLWLI